MSKEKETIRELASSLRSLALQQDVPSEEAVLAARRRREDGWRLVQADWLEGARGGEDLAAFLAEFAPAGTLADAYAQSVRHADAVADRLRREADRVARKAELQAALERDRANCAGLEHDLEILDDRQTVLEEEWKALVVPLGGMAQRWTPNELRAWLRGREEIVKLLEKMEEARQEVEPLEAAVASLGPRSRRHSPRYATGL